ncbi:MAG: hypothetical protein PHV32_11450 [Eubacteriales bacterium]|nr:hypothetical protein [Eubacteriales bacterium]
MSTWVFFFLLVVPGLFSLMAFRSKRKRTSDNCCYNIIIALVFDLIILIINSLWVKLFCIAEQYGMLSEKFNNIGFTIIYASVSVVVALLLGLIAGCFGKKECSNKQQKPLPQSDKGTPFYGQSCKNI